SIASAGERPPPTSPHVLPSTDVTAGFAESAEASALRQLLCGMASALRDAGLRHRVLADMRMAPFREHKIELRTYLRSPSGGVLLAKMAQATGRGRSQLLALLDSVC